MGPREVPNLFFPSLNFSSPFASAILNYYIFLSLSIHTYMYSSVVVVVVVVHTDVDFLWLAGWLAGWLQ